MRICALILAKSRSRRLETKNILPFHGKPMFIVNVLKCLKIFKEVYVSSDSDEILNMAKERGAIPIKRGLDLCGRIPNISVYRHAMKSMKCDAFVAVQANSPTVDPKIIRDVKKHIQKGIHEVMTCRQDGTIYGSVWAMTKERLEEYTDFYKPTFNLLIVDTSVDIHYKSDYNKALNQI